MTVGLRDATLCVMTYLKYFTLNYWHEYGPCIWWISIICLILFYLLHHGITKIKISMKQIAHISLQATKDRFSVLLQVFHQNTHSIKWPFKLSQALEIIFHDFSMILPKLQNSIIFPHLEFFLGFSRFYSVHGYHAVWFLLNGNSLSICQLWPIWSEIWLAPTFWWMQSTSKILCICIL